MTTHSIIPTSAHKNVKIVKLNTMIRIRTPISLPVLLVFNDFIILFIYKKKKKIDHTAYTCHIMDSGQKEILLGDGKFVMHSRDKVSQ
jgi:hypothetical protein